MIEEPYCDVCGNSGDDLRTPVEVCRDCYDLARDPENMDLWYPRKNVRGISPKTPHRSLSIKPFFRWYDLWIGAYWDRANRALYLCPLPCVGLKIGRDT